MLQNLIDSIDRMSIVSDPYFTITEIRWQEELVLRLNVSVDRFQTLEEPELPYEEWEITCRNVLVNQVTTGDSGEAEGFELIHDDPRLLTLKEQRTELFMASRPPDRFRLAGRLLKAHQQVARGLIPFHEFFNNGIRLDQLLDNESALIATGPVTFIKSYARAFDEERVQYTVVGNHSPHPRIISKETEGKLPMLLEFSDSHYVAAYEFKAQRLSKEAKLPEGYPEDTTT